MGAKERGARARVGAIGAPEYLQQDYPRSAAALDRLPMEGDLRISERRSRVIKPDERIY